MNEQNVRVSVSVVADGNVVGRFDSAADTSEVAASTERSDSTGDERESDEVEPESAATFELYRDRADEWRWRLRHDNGNIIADGGEGYSSKAAARNGIESVRKNAPGATLTTR